MDIDISGSGAIGGSLDRLWAGAGHAVTFGAVRSTNARLMPRRAGPRPKGPIRLTPRPVVPDRVGVAALGPAHHRTPRTSLGGDRAPARRIRGPSRPGWGGAETSMGARTRARSRAGRWMAGRAASLRHPASHARRARASQDSCKVRRRDHRNWSGARGTSSSRGVRRAEAHRQQLRLRADPELERRRDRDRADRDHGPTRASAEPVRASRSARAPCDRPP